MKIDFKYQLQKSRIYSLIYCSMYRTLRLSYKNTLIKHKKLGLLTMKDFSFGSVPKLYCTNHDGNLNSWFMSDIDDPKLESIMFSMLGMIKCFSEANDILRTEYTDIVVLYNSKKYFIKHYYLLDDQVSLLSLESDKDTPVAKLNEIIFL